MFISTEAQIVLTAGPRGGVMKARKRHSDSVNGVAARADVGTRVGSHAGARRGLAVIITTIIGYF